MTGKDDNLIEAFKHFAYIAQKAYSRRIITKTQIDKFGFVVIVERSNQSYSHSISWEELGESSFPSITLETVFQHCVMMLDEKQGIKQNERDYTAEYQEGSYPFGESGYR